MNLVTASSEFSAEEIIDAGRECSPIFNSVGGVGRAGGGGGGGRWGGGN